MCETVDNSFLFLQKQLSVISFYLRFFFGEKCNKMWLAFTLGTDVIVMTRMSSILRLKSLVNFHSLSDRVLSRAEGMFFLPSISPASAPAKQA